MVVLTVAVRARTCAAATIDAQRQSVHSAQLEISTGGRSGLGPAVPAARLPTHDHRHRPAVAWRPFNLFRAAPPRPRSAFWRSLSPHRRIPGRVGVLSCVSSSVRTIRTRAYNIANSELSFRGFQGSSGASRLDIAASAWSNSHRTVTGHSLTHRRVGEAACLQPAPLLLTMIIILTAVRACS